MVLLGVRFRVRETLIACAGVCVCVCVCIGIVVCFTGDGYDEAMRARHNSDVIFHLCRAISAERSEMEEEREAWRRERDDHRMEEKKTAKLEKAMASKDREIANLRMSAQSVESEAGAEIETLRREKAELLKIQVRSIRPSQCVYVNCKMILTPRNEWCGCTFV